MWQLDSDDSLPAMIDLEPCSDRRFPWSFGEARLQIAARVLAGFGVP
jgi:hypothetical protein